MPISKAKKYEIAFKNLRHREIACLVQAVPQKNGKVHSSSETPNAQDKTRSKILKSLKKKLNSTITTPSKNCKPLRRLNTRSGTASKIIKKGVYVKNKLEIASSPKKQTSIDDSYSLSDIIENDNTPPKKPTSIDGCDSTSVTVKKCNLSPKTQTSIDGSDSTSVTVKNGNSPQKKKTSVNDIDSTPVQVKNGKSPVFIAETSKKRSYRKKADTSAKITPITDGEPASVAVEIAYFGAPVITPEPPVAFYRKKLRQVITVCSQKTIGSDGQGRGEGSSFCPSNTSRKILPTPKVVCSQEESTVKKTISRERSAQLIIPAVPHNTPAMCRTPNDNHSSNSSDFYSSLPRKRCQVITVGKRCRGRPRLSAPVTRVPVEHSEDSTLSTESDQRSRTSHRSRGHKSESGWGGSEDEDQHQEVSEYEMLRQKNIEENLKKLRELFSEQGLHFEKKPPDDTPKKRKSYSRNPLPPPRPKSQRMVRRSALPLDFCSLDEKLMMSDPDFM